LHYKPNGEILTQEYCYLPWLYLTLTANYCGAARVGAALFQTAARSLRSSPPRKARLQALRSRSWSAKKRTSWPRKTTAPAAIPPCLPEPNAYPNRVLLCGTHHRLIDKDHGVHFSVTQLHRLKADHEAWVDHLLSGTQTEAETRARKRQELLLEGASASRGRLVARWVADGVSPELALTLADDDTVGAPERLGRALPATGLAVLAGDFGSGSEFGPGAKLAKGPNILQTHISPKRGRLCRNLSTRW
jgi:hypothetical protein